MARTPWNLRYDAHIPTESEFHKLSLEIGLCSQILDRYQRNGIRLGRHKDKTLMRDLFTKNGASLGMLAQTLAWRSSCRTTSISRSGKQWAKGEMLVKLR